MELSRKENILKSRQKIFPGKKKISGKNNGSENNFLGKKTLPMI